MNRKGLWKTDGTEVGTVLVSGIDADFLTDLDGTLIFAGTDPVHGMALWKSDVTEAGTVLLKDINPGTGPGQSGSCLVFCQAPPSQSPVLNLPFL